MFPLYSLTENVRLFFYCYNPESRAGAPSEDENSCGGDRRLRRKQGAVAGAAVAEDKPRPKGRRPMRAPQLVRRHRSAGTNSPVDCWLARGRVPEEWERKQSVPGGEMFPLYSLTENVRLFFYCYNPESRAGAPSEDENSREGDRRLRRKQGAVAGAAVAEDKPRPKGRRPMRAPQLVRRHRSAGTNSPVDCWLARGRVPEEWERKQSVPGGEMFPLYSLTENVRLFFYCNNPGCRGSLCTIGDKNRCGGDNGKPKQGWRSTGKILLCPGTQHDFILYLEYTKNQQRNGQKNESRYFRQRTLERRKKIGSSGAKPKEP